MFERIFRQAREEIRHGDDQLEPDEEEEQMEEDEPLRIELNRAKAISGEGDTDVVEVEAERRQSRYSCRPWQSTRLSQENSSSIDKINRSWFDSVVKVLLFYFIYFSLDQVRRTGEDPSTMR